MVLYVRNALDALILYKVRDALHEPRLVYLVGKLRNDNLKAPVFLLDNLRARADNNFAPAGRVGGTDAAAPHNHGARREIRPLDMLHDVLKLRLRVIYKAAHRVDDLPHVMRGNIRRHTNRDTA